MSQIVTKRKTLNRLFVAFTMIFFFHFCTISFANSIKVNDCDKYSLGEIVNGQLVQNPDFIARKALDSCRNAIEEYPENPNFSFNLGLVLMFLKSDSAKEVLRFPANKGHVGAQLILSALLIESKNQLEKQEGLLLLEKAANNGEQTAIRKLVIIYTGKYGFPIKFEKSIEWLKKYEGPERETFSFKFISHLLCSEGEDKTRKILSFGFKVEEINAFFDSIKKSNRCK